MKTSTNQVFPSRQVGLRLLDWSGGVVSSSLGKSALRARILRLKVPELRIVRPAVEKHDLFKYATATIVTSGFWETIVVTALSISAIGAVAMALFAS